MSAKKTLATVLLSLTCLHNVCSILVRHSLDEYPQALCTDGTQAAYYHTYTETVEDIDRYSNYVIFLQGGGYCHTIEACHFRCQVANYLCTSWTSSMKDSHGILSDDSDLNPGFHDYYKVELPYCTGDMYIGRQPGTVNNDYFNFLGREVFTSMIDSLKSHSLIDEADNVILSGSSAGGAGVAFNCDYLKSLLPNANIWCIVDAAFFYPIDTPFRSSPLCDDPIDEVLRSGARMWNAPEVGQFLLRGWWSGIEQNLFIGSAKFDRFGMESYCGNTSNSKDLAKWGPAVISMVHEMTTLYPQVGIFLPGCVYHMMINDDNVFNTLTAGKLGITYASALDNWVHETGPFRALDTCVDEPFCNKHCKVNGSPRN